ncbi:VOC family protein [Streptomyces sp. ODS28]|uniref:VOC family protein n=1 Tax=Streptomyces sp. ODS28 TaxID=3136688 RepID=UPI0031EDD46D
MAGFAAGTPCWMDAMFTDLEGAKSFYGDVLGWTFGESASEYGNYTEAYRDGQAVAAVVPPMPGQESQSAWCLYFASPDAEATAAAVTGNGGEIVMGPMRVGDFGTMLLARDPGGVLFGVWQAGTHEGFSASGAPGAFAWAEVCTRDPEASDRFFGSLFSYRVRRMAGGEMDYATFALGEEPLLGRMDMRGQVPDEVAPFINVYFAVEDCDDAVARAVKHGAKITMQPADTPFGRVAALIDPQGAACSLVNPAAAKGEMPEWSDA